MQSGHPQFICIHQPIVSLRQPHAFTLSHQAEIRVPRGWAQAKGKLRSSRQRHSQHNGIIPIQYLPSSTAAITFSAIVQEYSRLGGGIIAHARVAIQVIFTYIQYGSCMGVQGVGRFQLKTGYLQHPGLRHCSGIHAAQERVQYRRANIARHFHVPTRLFHHLTDHGRYRRLAI